MAEIYYERVNGNSCAESCSQERKRRVILIKIRLNLCAVKSLVKSVSGSRQIEVARRRALPRLMAALRAGAFNEPRSGCVKTEALTAILAARTKGP